jgi:uncharacterized protein with HEPN domain
MSRDESLYLTDVRDSCLKILKYTLGMTYMDFVHDDLHFDAVLRNLEIIGEAAKHISRKTQQKYPGVKWRKIADFRNVIAHEYFGVNDETVWDVVENEIPILLEVTKHMLAEFDS